MTWAQRLQRVFGIDIETWLICAGAVRIIACIEDPGVIAKILTNLDVKGAAPQAPSRHAGRRPSGSCSARTDVSTMTLLPL